MSRQHDNQRQDQRRNEPGKPGEDGKLSALSEHSFWRKSRLFARGMNEIAAVQEDRSLEKSVRNQMKDRQTVGADAALHNHEAHLTDGRIAKGLFDVADRKSTRLNSSHMS